jgi:hypothetical protein
MSHLTRLIPVPLRCILEFVLERPYFPATYAFFFLYRYLVMIDRRARKSPSMGNTYDDRPDRLHSSIIFFNFDESALSSLHQQATRSGRHFFFVLAFVASRLERYFIHHPSFCVS